MVIWSQIYHWKNLFPGNKAIFIKDKCITGVSLWILKLWIFAHNKREHVAMFLQLWSRKRLWWMLVVPSEVSNHFWTPPLASVLLLLPSSRSDSLQSPSLGQLEPLCPLCWELQVPGGPHIPLGWPLANKGWYWNRKAQLLPLRKYKLRGIILALEPPRGIKQKLWLCLKSLLCLASASSPACLLHSLTYFFWKSFLHMLLACKSSSQGLLLKNHTYLTGSSSAPIHSVHRWLTQFINP